jgi:hypothetical protein
VPGKLIKDLLCSYEEWSQCISNRPSIPYPYVIHSHRVTKNNSEQVSHLRLRIFSDLTRGVAKARPQELDSSIIVEFQYVLIISLFSLSSITAGRKTLVSWRSRIWGTIRDLTRQCTIAGLICISQQGELRSSRRGPGNFENLSGRSESPDARSASVRAAFHWMIIVISELLSEHRGNVEQIRRSPITLMFNTTSVIGD